MDNQLEEKSKNLIKSIFEIPNNYDSDQMKEIVAKMRNSVVAIPTTIIEAKAKKTRNKSKNYITVARGYLRKLNSELKQSRDMGIVNLACYQKLETEIKSIDALLEEMLRNKKVLKK